MKKFLFPALLGLCFATTDCSAQPVRRILRGETPFRDALSGSCGAAGALGACSTAGSCSQVSGASVTVTAAPVAALAGRHPIAHEWVRLKFTTFLVKKGHNWSEARAMANSFSDQMLEEAGSAVGAPGGFFQNLLAALQKCEQDPTCSKFLAALMNYLFTLLGG